MSTEKSVSFDDIVSLAPEALQPVVCRLRDLVLAADPETCLVVQLGYRAANFGVGAKKMTESLSPYHPACAMGQSRLQLWRRA
ncbi:hypothetical protein PSQ19_15210 [Devosia algicola]|uniref:Uncharacterized protein n=1 Tax=Devosia algicola TaxID=3026418 RepID=A0ABY7YLB4_9HYPH|nr:hypothetical protein [Devosia algicola]WDR02017.1 hypothetical protein PSQ19_15210 [Devosia algicola]